MKPILFLITIEQLEDLASRSHLRYGKDIAKSGEIVFTKTNTFNIIARVKAGNGEPKITELMSTSKGFRWRCSCTNKKNYFCEHCVAVGMKAIMDQESKNNNQKTNE